MRRTRRIFGNIDSFEKKNLLERALGVTLDNGYFNHDLYEDSQEYINLKNLISPFNLQDDLTSAEFTDKEINESEILLFNGTWASGYPQPESIKAILKINFANGCPQCGVHDEQIAPLQIKEPKLGKQRMFQLNWIHDELFVIPELYESFFKLMPLEKREVILYKKDRPVQSVVQLNIPKGNNQLEITHLQSLICPVCNRVKYTPVISDFYPSPKEKDITMVKTQEFFGSGGKAFNRILVSNRTMNEMIKRKLAKIHQFAPTK